MAAKGGKRPGAGRKSFAQKALELKFACKAFSPDVQESTWNRLLASKDEHVVFKVASYLTDRIYGKAQQSVDLKHDGELKIVVDVVRPERGNKD
jgi:hypothetical protein